MKICTLNSSTSFKSSNFGDISKGRKEFEKLSDIEKVGKLGVEEFRQRFNKSNVGFKLSAPEGDLNGYARYRVIISKVMKNVLAKFKSKKPL